MAGGRLTAHVGSESEERRRNDAQMKRLDVTDGQDE